MHTTTTNITSKDCQLIWHTAVRHCVQVTKKFSVKFFFCTFFLLCGKYFCFLATYRHVFGNAHLFKAHFFQYKYIWYIPYIARLHVLFGTKADLKRAIIAQRIIFKLKCNATDAHIYKTLAQVKIKRWVDASHNLTFQRVMCALIILPFSLWRRPTGSRVGAFNGTRISCDACVYTCNC